MSLVPSTGGQGIGQVLFSVLILAQEERSELVSQQPVVDAT